MKGRFESIWAVLAFALALAGAPMSVAFADDDLGVDDFDVLDDSDSEEGSILELGDSDDSEDVDSDDVDSEDSDSEDSDSEDFDSEDSDGDLDDSDSEDDSDEDLEETPSGDDD